jgi:hypothetical protein
MEDNTTGTVNTSSDGVINLDSLNTTSTLWFSGYNARLNFVQPLIMKWAPQEDITTYELALCINYLYGFKRSMPGEIADEKPEVLRHFQITDPNKKQDDSK